MVVATSKFRMLTDQVAKSLDAADIRVLEVPHPLGGTDDATILSWADAAVAATVELFTGQAPMAQAEKPADVSTAIAEMQALVAADGGELVLDSFDGAVANFTLVLDSAECRECVMPAEHLEAILLDKLRPHAPALGTVRIADPRV